MIFLVWIFFFLKIFIDVTARLVVVKRGFTCFLQYVAKYKIRQNTAWVVRHTSLFATILLQISCKWARFPPSANKQEVHIFLLTFSQRGEFINFSELSIIRRKKEITSLFFFAYDIRVMPYGVICFLLFLMYHLLNEFPPLSSH